MQLSDEIRILDLLARREGEWLRVKECEEAIWQILGQERPLPPPPTPLPSAKRTNAKKAWQPPSSLPQKKSGAMTARKKSTVLEQASLAQPLLRPLNPAAGETAYRILYLDCGKQCVSYHAEQRTVEEVLRLHCQTFHVCSISTVAFHEEALTFLPDPDNPARQSLALDDFPPIAVLWKDPLNP